MMNNMHLNGSRPGTLAALVLSLLWAGSAAAQINIDAYRDYFLVGRFGEVCTMCEVTVLCEAGEQLPEYESIPEAGTFTVYHLQTRTFWSQIATIWEWFISNFTAEALASRGHTRPVDVYTVAAGEWSARQTIEARLILDPGVLEFGDYNIDRVSRAWQRSDDGIAVGYCERTPLWESLDSISANTSGDE